MLYVAYARSGLDSHSLGIRLECPFAKTARWVDALSIAIDEFRPWVEWLPIEGWC
jgi:hypothetical protein